MEKSEAPKMRKESEMRMAQKGKKNKEKRKRKQKIQMVESPFFCERNKKNAFLKKPKLLAYE